MLKAQKRNIKLAKVLPGLESFYEMGESSENPLSKNVMSPSAV